MHDKKLDVQEEILLLYELLLSIGDTLDPQATSRSFLRSLMARRQLTGASIWWRDSNSEQDPGGAMALLDGIPRAQLNRDQLPPDHPLCRLALGGKARAFNASDAGYSALDIDTGSVAVSWALFPLGGDGFLLMSSPSVDLFTPRMLGQLRAVVNKLTAALQGGFAHTRLRRSEATLRERGQQLDESRNLLQAIIDTTPVRVFWKDRDLRYLGCNPAFARDALAGSPEGLVGKSDYEMSWAEHADRYRADDREVIEQGLSKIGYEEPNTTPDGSRTWVSSSKVPLRDRNQQIIGVLGMYEDITERKQAQLRLSESEEHFRTLVEAVPDSIQFKDGQGRWLIANRVCLQMFGLLDEHWLGQSDTELAQHHPHLRQTLNHCVDSDTEAWASGEIYRTEETVIDQQGTHHFDVTKIPLFDADGDRQALVIIGRDVTEARRNQEELERYRHELEALVEQRTNELLETEARASHIVNSSAGGMYGVDTQGKLTFINPAACSMLGLRAKEAIGRRAHTLFHHSRADGTPLAEAQCALIRGMTENRVMRVDDEVYWHADGHAVPVIYAVHPLHLHGQLSGAVVSFIDVSAQRAAAEARERALAAAENLARVKSEFLANMSHEIRTPLNGVLGFAQIGARHAGNDAKAQNAFEKIIDSGKTLLGVINEILDFSKIEAEQLRIDHIATSLREVIDHAMGLVTLRAQGKGLTLQTDFADLPQTCMSDPLRLGQVLINLLSNAVKFTERGQVTVQAGLRDDRLVFAVIDTGIGIEKEQLERLFDPFIQVDGSSTRRFGGTGLGLAISKRILDLMGGDIRVESEPGRGSRFEFSLPYVANTGAVAGTDSPPGDTPPTTQRLAGLTILVAEDVEVNQLILEDMLCSEGAEVVIAGDGNASVEQVVRRGGAAFDVVLMDIQMPGLNGYEAARHIRTLRPRLPIIGQTAHAFPQERQKCLDAGMVDHVSKPIDQETLVTTILRHLNR